MTVTVDNLFAREPTAHERFEELCADPRARIERIWGPVREPSKIYDQAHDEWVVLLCGRAELELEQASVALRAGDHLLIPAGARHRVLSASEDALWLAVHFAA